MKSNFGWILLILIGVVVALYWRDNQLGKVFRYNRRPGYYTLNNPKPIGLLTEAKKTRILAQTLTIGSNPNRLPEGKPIHGEVRVSADSSNSGDVYLADSEASISTGPRFTIEAGGSMPIKVTEISSLYYGGTSGDTVSIMAEVESF